MPSGAQFDATPKAYSVTTSTVQSKMSTPRSVFVVCLLALCIANFASADWWDSANFYQIYPRSFKDSDGDGIGDLRGITDKLPYLKSLGVTGTWLSPIFSSPMADFGYDISDFKNISSIFGTLADFDNLVVRCNELGIKLILDFGMCSFVPCSYFERVSLLHRFFNICLDFSA